MPDDLTPPQERAVRLALTAARYRTTLAATAAALDQIAVTAHRQAIAIRTVLQPGDYVCAACGAAFTDPDEFARHDADHDDDPQTPAELTHRDRQRWGSPAGLDPRITAETIYDPLGDLL